MEAIFGICGLVILSVLGFAGILVIRSQVLPLWRDLFHGHRGSENER